MTFIDTRLWLERIGRMHDARRDFTIRQLTIFVAVARAGNFGRAAQQLGISQPAVSSCIAKLEARLERCLFLRRAGAPPLLTREGRELLEKAEGLLRTSDAIRADAAELDSGRRRVRLCIGPLLRDRYLKPLLPRLYRDHPEIELELVPVIPHGDVQAALDKRQIDLIVITVGRIAEGWANVRLIGQIPTVMVGPPGIRAQLEARVMEIADLPFILPATGNLSEHWTEGQLRRLGYELRQPVVYLDFPDVIQEMVAAGQGISVLMREQVAQDIANGRLEVCGPDFPPMQRVIARGQGAGAAVQLVEDYLVAALGSADPLSTAAGDA
jgi:DNA-binding transcriptional LysR family regulator